jgi:hypothetical protein
MKEIGVSVSKKQLSRLKNGHSVRVKQGEGLLVVNPNRYDLMSRTFAKGKSHTLALSPEEILLNTRGFQPETHQTNAGYIPKKSDSERVATAKSSTYKGTPTEKALSLLSKPEQDELKKHMSQVDISKKKLAVRQFLEDYLLIQQAKKLSAERRRRNEELQRMIDEGEFGVGDYVPPTLSPLASIDPLATLSFKATEADKKNKARVEAFKELPQGSGISKFVSNAGGPRTKNGNYQGNYLLDSGVANATAGMVQKAYIRGGIESARRNQMMVGMGMGYGFHRPHTEGVSNRGTILRRGNPALESQPFSSNFNMASQLPPAFQRFHTSV